MEEEFKMEENLRMDENRFKKYWWVFVLFFFSFMLTFYITEIDKVQTFSLENKNNETENINQCSSICKDWLQVMEVHEEELKCNCIKDIQTFNKFVSEKKLEFYNDYPDQEVREYLS